jgi:predicted flap endonuclease-1-like 5' DNA nuclease
MDAVQVPVTIEQRRLPMNVVDVEGIGPAYAAKLETAGVKTTDDLLARGAKPKGREELEKATGISGAKILEWVNRVDLYRLNGVGSEYSDLLEASGVDSPAELAHRVPANLVAKMEEINEAKKLVRRVPTETMVAGWVEQAKKLPKIVEH